MRSLTDHLANYAAYHRDRRNLATHFVGIPLIVFAIAVLLSRPAFTVGGLALNPAWLAVAASGAFYLRLNIGYGAAMTALLALAVWAAGPVAALPTAAWLGWGLGLFAGGWALQFVGHWLEGRKPAFVDDLIGLLIGPLFLVAETAFALGLDAGRRQDVEARAGPVRGGRRAQSA